MDDRPCHPRSVWTAMKDGFNANEIAYMWGVSLATALGMMRAAIPKAPKRETLKRAA
jgi:hypothetical protein